MGRAEGPARQGLKDQIGLGEIGGGVLFDPSGEFGAFGYMGPVGGGAYVSYSCK